MINKRSNRYFSDKQEKHIAKVLDGKQTANSGATAFSKGDIRTDLFLIEAKTVTKSQKSFTVKKEWLEKNKEEAFAMNKQYSAVAIDFGDGDNFYIIDEKTFKLFHKLLEQEETL